MRRRRLVIAGGGVLAGFLVVTLAVVAAIALVGSNSPGAQASTPSSSAHTSSAPVVRTIPVPVVSAAERARLPQATTLTTVAGSPVDLAAASDGNVAQIAQATVGFATAGGRPVTVIPAQQLGSPTWLPVIGSDANWIQVRLPSRPNGVTAWIPSTGIRTARTNWQVKINLKAQTLTVLRAGVQQGSWTVGQGGQGTPTPTGQTFLLAGFVDPQQDFSPVIFALGMHSDTLDSYGGGPGTVAVHGWPVESGRVGYVSHGCVRVPAAALDMFKRLPAGTPVDITD